MDYLFPTLSSDPLENFTLLFIMWFIGLGFLFLVLYVVLEPVFNYLHPYSREIRRKEKEKRRLKKQKHLRITMEVEKYRQESRERELDKRYLFYHLTRMPLGDKRDKMIQEYLDLLKIDKPEVTWRDAIRDIKDRAISNMTC